MTGRYSLNSLGGIEIDAVTLNQAADRCEQTAITKTGCLHVGVYNAAKVVTVQKDATLKEAINQCELIIADGQALVWAAQLLKYPLPERVTGIDLFSELLIRANKHKQSIFFTGSKAGGFR